MVDGDPPLASPDEPAVIPYASTPPPRRRHFHAWVLPLLWLPGAWSSRVNHGDEYFGFLMANLPTGLLIGPVIKALGRWVPAGAHWMPAIIAAGFFLWATIGWLLDRLRAWRLVYLAVPVAFLVFVWTRIAVTPHIPPIADYPGQEWEWDSATVAYCWAVYAVAAVTFIGALFGRLVRWSVKRPRRAAPAHSAD